MDIISEVQRAIEFSKQKDYKKAEKIYLEILETDYNNHVVLSLLGLLYMNMCCFKKSEKYLEKAIAIKETLPTVEGLGIVKSYLNKTTEAIKYLELAITDTKSFEVYDRYIKTLIEIKKYKKAYDYALKCLERYPLKPEALDNAVYTAIHSGKLNEAFEFGNQLVNKYPKYANGWFSFGLVLEMLYHDDTTAGECYMCGYKLGAKEAGCYNLAVNYEKRNMYDKALYYAKKLQKISKNDDSVYFLLANIYFKQKKFKQAMKFYANYVLTHSFNEVGNPIKKLKNIWNGKKYKNETIFVFCDQGIGDGLMFIRYLPFLNKYFKKIKVMVSDRIIELLKRSYKEYKSIEFYPMSKRFPKYDKSVILSSLPYFLKMNFNNIPFSKKYIISKEELKNKYSNIINSDKLKVGICWEAGGIGWRELLNRTLNVSLYAPFLKIDKIQFYSLQVNPTMDNYKEYKNLIELGSSFKNFDDTAGAIENLDLVITVDTSVAHLAGAMGIKTFLLLPYCPDWRWFDDDKITNWYDSVRIFKQTKSADWEDVINDIYDELKLLIK